MSAICQIYHERFHQLAVCLQRRWSRTCLSKDARFQSTLLEEFDGDVARDNPDTVGISGLEKLAKDTFLVRCQVEIGTG